MENAVLVEDTPEHKEIPLTSHQFSIGRGLDNSLVVDDISVSRKHTLLEFKDNEWYIYDTSSNGTWLNSSHVNKYEYYRLTDGDVLKLSDSCTFTFKIQHIDVSLRACLSQQMGNAVQGEHDGVDISYSLLPRECSESDAAAFPYSGNTAAALEETSASNDNMQPSSSILNSSEEVSKYDIESVEDELQCSVCTEMFIDAVTLGCSHTFCNYCITVWKKAKADCPICRTPITAQFPAIILNNYIEKKVNSSTDEFRKHRMDSTVDRKHRLESTDTSDEMLPQVIDNLDALLMGLTEDIVQISQFLDDDSAGVYIAHGNSDDNDVGLSSGRRRCLSADAFYETANYNGFTRQCSCAMRSTSP